MEYNNQEYRNKLKELEEFFKSAKLPKEPIKLNEYTTINDVALFVSTNMDMFKEQINNPLFAVYLDRVDELRRYINSHKN